MAANPPSRQVSCRTITPVSLASPLRSSRSHECSLQAQLRDNFLVSLATAWPLRVISPRPKQPHSSSHRIISSPPCRHSSHRELHQPRVTPSSQQGTQVELAGLSEPSWLLSTTRLLRQLQMQHNCRAYSLCLLSKEAQGC